MLHGYLDLPTFTFWEEGNIWTGSVFQTFNYRIFKDTADDKNVLHAAVWYGLDCYDLVKPEDIRFDLTEEFSPDGLSRVIDALNVKADEYKKSLV